MKPPAISMSAKKKELIVGVLMIAVILVSKSGQMCILAFSSNDAISQVFRVFPMILCIGTEVLALGYRKLRMAAAIFLAGLLGFLPPHFVGFGRMLSVIYGSEIYLSQNYASSCLPTVGEAMEGDVIRICERRGWGQLDMDAVVVKFEGNVENLINKKYSKPPQRVGHVKRLIPFGVVKYDCIHITGSYYLLLFGEDPVLLNNS